MSHKRSKYAHVMRLKALQQARKLQGEEGDLLGTDYDNLFKELLGLVTALTTELKEARGWVLLCEDMCKDVSEPLSRIDALLEQVEGPKNET